MARIRFPQGFQFGAATSAYQIEGAWREDGKSESIWDRFAHESGRIRGGATGDRACDSYHRMRDDVALLREMGCASYRFSIAWPRVQPGGRGPANARGVDYYQRLCDALLAAGIRPFPTLYHWDLPVEIEERGGWAARDTAGRFADYADLVARALGDRVESFTLLNEPSVFTTFGYRVGYHAPGRRDRNSFWAATHIVNLAQAEAFRAMRATLPAARLGSAFHFSPCEPARDTEADARAAERWYRFTNEWFLRPAFDRAYPDIFPADELMRRLRAQPEDFDRLAAPFDFIGVNLYTRTRVAAVEGGPIDLDAAPSPHAAESGAGTTDFGWEIWPDAMRAMLVRLTRDFTRGDSRPILEITENGCSYGDGVDDDGRVRDVRRIDFLRGQLEAVHRAIEEGADVRSYHAWSLLDNFEWCEGFAQRFGLAHVDFDTCERTIKDSGRWYAEVIAANGFDT